MSICDTAGNGARDKSARFTRSPGKELVVSGADTLADGGIAFYTALMPSNVVEQRAPDERPHELSTIDAASALDNDCVARVTDDDLPAKLNHLGTQLLRVRDCRRGHCSKRAAWLQVGIANRKRLDWVYDTRALVFEGRPPYRLLSVSHPLIYAGISTRDFAYTISMAWAEPRFEDGRLIGYLDDRFAGSLCVRTLTAAASSSPSG